jgi:hypothetical protein
MEELFRRVKPLDLRGRPKRSWAVCDDCLRYWPARRSYWKTKREDWVEMETCEWTVEDWSLRLSRQCPVCWCEEKRLALRELGSLNPTEGVKYKGLGLILDRC